MIDTSAWVEFFRETGSPADFAVDAALNSGFHICDAVRMEVLVGADDDDHARALRLLLARGAAILTRSVDFDAAASIRRACRREGETPRNLVDCLIAAQAIRVGQPVLHRDRDFETIARHTPLQLVAL